MIVSWKKQKSWRPNERCGCVPCVVSPSKSQSRRERLWVICKYGLWIFFGVCFAVSVDKAQADGRIRMQMGCEADTNPTRSVLSTSTDQLLRMVVEAELTHVSGRHSVAANYLGGFKLHFRQSSEDLIATQLGGLYSYQLSPTSLMGIRTSIVDASLREHDRDYFIWTGDVVFGSRLTSRLSYMIHLGGSYFLFKPDGRGFYRYNFSHYAPTAEFALNLHLTKRLSVSSYYQVERRTFDDTSYRIVDDKLQPTQSNRIDLRHMPGVSLQYELELFSGKMLIIDTAYSLFINDSNSAGSSALWHRYKLALSMQLPWDLNLHLIGTFQLTRYKDAMYIDQNLYEPDADEKENSLVIRLHVPIFDVLSLVIQAGFYRNDFHNDLVDVLPYSRNTFMLGLDTDFGL